MQSIRVFASSRMGAKTLQPTPASRLRSLPIYHSYCLSSTLSHTQTAGSTVDPETKADKERIVILGSGWGGFTLSRRLSRSKFSTTVVSPRSYFVFTPLLTDSAVGTLNFSEIVEPVRDRKSQVHFIQAAARAVDFQRKVVTCEASIIRSGVTESARVDESEREFDEGPEIGPFRGKESLRKWETGQIFDVPYDKLVIAVGCVTRTFNVPGVRENAMFLKDVGDARRVKRRVRECFELAVMPATKPEMRRHLLHFAIVGGGPTGTELAAAICDFIHEDIVKIYPKIREDIRITLYDVAPRVLSMFDESLSKYAMEIMKREGVTVKTNHHIQSLRWGEPNKEPHGEMDPKGCLTLTTKEEGEVGAGICVWTTGNEMNKFVNRALGDLESFPESSAMIRGSAGSHTQVEQAGKSRWHVSKAPKTGAILVDNHLHVLLKSDDDRIAVMRDVFALGDNCMIETGSPPATAQATNQEARWLAARLNQGNIDTAPGFSFRNLGMLAYLGDSKALMQLPHDSANGSKDIFPSSITGRTAWLIWKAAYLSMSLSWKNRLRILISWFSSWAFGRDISRY
ncbi:hypothetical protein VTO42DRAFT_5177 [Malbranchea cinnamomea]